MTMQEYKQNGLKLEKKTWAATLFGILWISGVFGFIYETIFYIINNGVLTRRGSSFGPWIQIYSFGGIFIFLMCYKLRKRPWLVFIVSGVVCSVLEYIAGYCMDKFAGFRSWDYDTEIWNWGNINGYVCARSALVFAAAGLLLIYVILPTMMKLRDKIGDRAYCIIMFVIGGICLADILYNDVFAKMLGTLDAITFYGRTGWYKIVTGYFG